MKTKNKYLNLKLVMPSDKLNDVLVLKQDLIKFRDHLHKQVKIYIGNQFIEDYLKTLLVIMFVVLTQALDAQVNVHAGCSPIKGMVGLELQQQRWSVSGGYSLAKTVNPVEVFSGYSAALTYYKDPVDWKAWSMWTLYASAGVRSNGWVREVEDGLRRADPTASLLVGVRAYLHDLDATVTRRLSFDAGVGVVGSKYHWGPDFELQVNYTLIK